MLKASEARCGNCIGCFRTSNCEKCENCINNVNPCVRRICVQAAAIAADQNGNNDKIASGKRDDKKKYTKKGKKDTPGRPGRKPKNVVAQAKEIEIDNKNGDVVRKRKPHKPHKPHVWLPKELRVAKNRKSWEIAQQCYGPNCVKASRPGSKYCSDECGLKMADDRLRRILPSRVRDYYSVQPLAEKTDDKLIRDLTVRKALAEGEIEQANQFALTLNLYVSQLSRIEPTVQQNRSHVMKDMSIVMSCGVCGEEVPLCTLAQHVNDCYAQLEQRSVYGSKHSLSENPHELICDEFDANTGTYCKRLRFACSEHYDDNLGSQMKCCGYPMKWTSAKSLRLPEIFATLDMMLSGGICLRNRWHCNEHRLWEQNLRALLDSHRMRLNLYLDHISASYHRVAAAYRTRGDCLSLLTNWRTSSAEARRQEEMEIRKKQQRATMSQPGDLTATKTEEQSVEALYNTIINLARASRLPNPNGSQEAARSSSGLLTSGLVNDSVPGELLPLTDVVEVLNENLNIDSGPLTDGSNRVLNNNQFVLGSENVLEQFAFTLPAPVKIE
ncbi:hypothetical protein M3Y98_00173800 [Aphelenchoides besseyi]|nr:hypothetical protein M3Y98_00173800 [Aphelenchoides besseyi]KAI6200033.1 hypothetical protein M3Y96_00690600 [Aphelenchoides besseyi]